MQSPDLWRPYALHCNGPIQRNFTQSLKAPFKHARIRERHLTMTGAIMANTAEHVEFEHATLGALTGSLGDRRAGSVALLGNARHSLLLEQPITDFLDGRRAKKGVSDAERQVPFADEEPADRRAGRGRCPGGRLTMQAQAKRLLAIDGDVSSAELIARIAERCRYAAFATSDSRGVMNLTTALKPSILAVDICMPSLDANDLLERLARRGYTGRILIVSGQGPHVLEEARQRALALGLSAPHALQKPLDIPALRSILLDGELAPAA